MLSDLNQYAAKIRQRKNFNDDADPVYASSKNTEVPSTREPTPTTIINNEKMSEENAAIPSSPPKIPKKKKSNVPPPEPLNGKSLLDPCCDMC